MNCMFQMGPHIFTKIVQDCCICCENKRMILLKCKHLVMIVGLILPKKRLNTTETQPVLYVGPRLFGEIEAISNVFINIK